MSKAPLLVLIDIAQTLADVQNAILILLSLRIELAQVFIRQRTIKKVLIQLAFFFRTQHQTDFLDTTLHQLFQQDEDDWTHHTIGTWHGEEIFLDGTGGGIEACAKACHRDDSLADGMYGMYCQGIGLHTLSVQIVYQLLLGLRTTCQELHRSIAM